VARDRLLVFLKRPRPGEVKTRLAPALGAAQAAELYRALAEEELRRTAARAGEYERVVCFTPEDARSELEAWLRDEPLLPQRGEDLGQRLAAAFGEAFAAGARRVAVIGSDAPWVSRATVLEALAALDEQEVAVVPALDGGYCLLALSRARPELFGGIPWSTRAVLGLTLERAAGLGLSVRLLEPQPDIDTLEDLRAHWPRLRGLLASRPALAAAVEAALSR
jgi:hypothetical protein